jgi:hypothetical protein
MKIKTRALRHEFYFVPSRKEFSCEKNGLTVSDGDAGGYHRSEADKLIQVGSEDPSKRFLIH